MKLIVGLGNPGREYARTRHNAGFRALDVLATRLGVDFARRKFGGQYAEGELPAAFRGPAEGDGKLLLVKPQTFMNLSGAATRDFLGYFKVARSGLLVVVDEVALPVGMLRLREDGSAGGHNGLKDIERCLGGRDYSRLREGVGGRVAGAEPAAGDLKDHVLGRLAPAEEKLLAEALERAAAACLVWAGAGPDEAMNRFNARDS